MFEKRGLVLKLEIENEDTRSRANEMQGRDFHHVLIDGSVTINQKQIAEWTLRFRQKRFDHGICNLMLLQHTY